MLSIIVDYDVVIVIIMHNGHIIEIARLFVLLGE
jgi:hypothetical protein